MKNQILLTVFLTLSMAVSFGQCFITPTITPCMCYGDCNGSASVFVSGGTAPYSYNWSPNITDTTSLADSLCSGLYFLTVTDAIGCTDTTSFNITQPAPIQIGLSITPESCLNCCDGIIIANTTGGTPPYFYYWSCTIPNQNNDTVTGLCSGQCIVCITDANGCTECDSSNIVVSVSLLNASTGFSIYPNPANEKIFIQSNNLNNINTSLTIFNTIGEIVLTAKLNDRSENIDIDFLENGVYYICIYNGTETIRQKLIKNAP